MPPDSSTNRLLRATLLLFVLFVAFILPSLPGYGYDAWCWREWTKHIMGHGLPEAYGSGTDYPPVMHYILWLFGAVMGKAESVELYYPFLRLFTLAVELLGVSIVWRWTGRRSAYAALALFWLLNIAASYNTIVWGQVDGILATVVFAALWLAWNEKAVASAVVMTVALLFKLQAVVFVPMWGLLVLGNLARERSWERLPAILLTVAATALFILLPFILTDASRTQLAEAFFSSVDRYPNISKSASNWWHLVAYQKAEETDDQIWFGEWTYKTVGFAAFLAASAVALWPLLRYTLRQFGREGAAIFPRERLWLTAAIIAVNFFFWPTQMHERYSHPAIIFLLAYALTSRDWLPYILFSVAYLLNLELVMRALHLKNYDTGLFDTRVNAAMFGVLIVYLCARLYGWRGFLQKAEEAAPTISARPDTA